MESWSKSKSILAALALMSCDTGVSKDTHAVLDNSNIADRVSRFAHEISGNRLTYTEYSQSYGSASGIAEKSVAAKQSRILSASLGKCLPRDNRDDLDEQDRSTRQINEYNCDVDVKNLRFSSFGGALGEAYIELRPFESPERKPGGVGYFYDVSFENQISRNVRLRLSIQSNRDLLTLLDRKGNTPIVRDSKLAEKDIKIRLHRVSFFIEN